MTGFLLVVIGVLLLAIAALLCDNNRLRGELDDFTVFLGLVSMIDSMERSADDEAGPEGDGGA